MDAIDHELLIAVRLAGARGLSAFRHSLHTASRHPIRRSSEANFQALAGTFPEAKA